MKKAVLLVNLGSPDSTKVSDVRRYLRQFLSDPRVIDAPYLIRQFILNCFILPFRPKRSAEAYSNIWTPQGSPLILTSKKLQSQLQEKFPFPIELAMSYGSPSIPNAIQSLKKQNITDLFIIPLFPHYAMSSYETALVAVTNQILKSAPSIQPHPLPPFYNDPAYINALLLSAKPYLDKGFDKLLFSYHGIPERHLRKSDPSHDFCLRVPNCCKIKSASHHTCYRHQCFETTRLFAQAAGLQPHQFSISFQSRLGRDPWLQPYTDHTIAQLAQSGTRNLLVICPAFVADCLETLEEIAIEGKHSFLHHGGSSFEQIPCLNNHPAWVDFLQQKISQWIPS